MSEGTIKILLVEDNAGDARLLREAIAAASNAERFKVKHVERLDRALDCFGPEEEQVDIILLDLSLPDAYGLETLVRMRRQAHGVPIVVLTGDSDETMAVEAVKQGAQDYLVKGETDGNVIVRAIRYSIERNRIKAKLKDTLAQNEKSRSDLLSILNQFRAGTVLIDEHGLVTFLSQTTQSILGKTSADMLGKQWEEVCPFTAEEKAELKRMAELPQAQRVKVPMHFEIKGRRMWLEVEIRDDPRTELGRILFIYDVSEVHNLRSMLSEKAQFQNIIGKSKLMQTVFQQVRNIAEVDSTVLIEGETGTGKELVAKALHYTSPRQPHPFIAINCAGLTDSLLNSQLFGHKRGAFTGAVQDHIGLFEAANCGTLFLDEIGDVPLNVQANLLRALQEREIMRLGETKTRKIDVRVIAATHRSLNEEVAKGNFRADLLYRIRVMRIQIPALRERREDVPLLVESFMGQYRAATGKQVQGVSPESMRRLMEYDWPGNVRELKSALEFAVIQCQGAIIQEDDLPPEIIDSNFPQALATNELPTDEREQLLAVLEQARGNRTIAARLLGISRATFYRRLTEIQEANAAADTKREHQALKVFQ